MAGRRFKHLVTDGKSLTDVLGRSPIRVKCHLGAVQSFPARNSLGNDVNLAKHAPVVPPPVNKHGDSQEQKYCSNERRCGDVMKLEVVRQARHIERPALEQPWPRIELYAESQATWLAPPPHPRPSKCRHKLKRAKDRSASADADRKRRRIQLQGVGEPGGCSAILRDPRVGFADETHRRFSLAFYSAG